MQALGARSQVRALDVVAVSGEDKRTRPVATDQADHARERVNGDGHAHVFEEFLNVHDGVQDLSP